MNTNGGRGDEVGGHHAQLYSLPHVYDLAFSYRDFAAEVSCLLELIAPTAPSELSVLDIACGTGRHVLEFARLGANALGLDDSAEMCHYASSLASHSPTSGQARFEQARLDEYESISQLQPQQLAVCLNDSIAYVHRSEDLAELFSVVGRVLSPGGLFVVETRHPRDVFGVGTSTDAKWTIAQDHESVTVHWGVGGPRLDPVTQLDDYEIEVQYESLDSSISFRESGQLRRYTTQEVALAALASGIFVEERALGAFDTNVPITDEKAWRSILVYKRRSRDALLA